MNDVAHPILGPAVPMRRYWTIPTTVVRTFIRLFHPVRVQGAENVPRAGGLIVAANHLAFWDPPLVGGFCPREVWFLAKQELFTVPGLAWVIRQHNAIPIKRASTDREGLTRAIRLIQSGRALLIFPEGGRSVPGVLRPPRAGVGQIALDAGGAPIVPAYIAGTRGTPGRATFSLTFGPPVWPLAEPAVQEAQGRDRARVLSVLVMEHIAALRDAARA